VETFICSSSQSEMISGYVRSQSDPLRESTKLKTQMAGGMKCQNLSQAHQMGQEEEVHPSETELGHKNLQHREVIVIYLDNKNKAK
jgi:hypothetical protein